MVDDDELETCLRVLANLRHAGPEHEAYVQVERAVAAFYKQGKKSRRLGRKQARTQRDRRRIEATGRVATPLQLPEVGHESSPVEYERARVCYVCKTVYRKIDGYYHRLCPACAAFHGAARERRGDLRGRRAIVTGGRIKIGFELARMLLRDGAHVTVLTRFPQDAWRRFAALTELEDLRERLDIVGMDLRYLPGVVQWCRDWTTRGRTLDILVNNAAQTIRRPPAYYRELAAGELSMLVEDRRRSSMVGLDGATERAATALAEFHRQCLADEDIAAFPTGLQTEEGVPLDLRGGNSWTLELADVDTTEMMEVQLVSAMAPFVLMARLRSAMERSSFGERFVVNVSAMEGKFDYVAKTTRHPHTNMAKAALNMLTRTSADDYVRSSIFVNSVDTGWVTDENPEPLKQRMRAHGFHPPLDVVDGAARIYAPILDGLEGRPYCGRFLKDYRPTTW